MTHGKKDSHILSFIGQKRYSHAVADLYKTQREAKSSCTFTSMAEGDKVEFHTVQRQREFYTKNFAEKITENNRERFDLLQNLQKLPLYIRHS